MQSFSPHVPGNPPLMVCTRQSAQRVLAGLEGAEDLAVHCAPLIQALQDLKPSSLADGADGRCLQPVHRLLARGGGRAALRRLALVAVRIAGASFREEHLPDLGRTDSRQMQLYMWTADMFSAGGTSCCF